MKREAGRCLQNLGSRPHPSLKDHINSAHQLHQFCTCHAHSGCSQIQFKSERVCHKCMWSKLQSRDENWEISSSTDICTTLSNEIPNGYMERMPFRVDKFLSFDSDKDMGTMFLVCLCRFQHMSLLDDHTLILNMILVLEKTGWSYLWCLYLRRGANWSISALLLNRIRRLRNVLPLEIDHKLIFYQIYQISAS